MDVQPLRINVGEKYALVAVPRAPIDALALPSSVELAPGIWFSKRPPVLLAEHWKEWIGSVRAKQLETTAFCLCAKGASKLPAVLDCDNQKLTASVKRVFQGLLLAMPVWFDGEVALMTGANREGGVDVRQISTLSTPAPIHYGKSGLIGEGALRLATELAPVLDGFPVGKYRRLCRVLNAYFSGLEQGDLRERLHQFCRCIEGLILPEAGKTTKQFKSRTELFVGPGFHDLTGDIYENRSAVEHMNDPVLDRATELERRTYFYELALVSEHIARSCICNVLRRPELLGQFEDDASLAAFWSGPTATRSKTWGAPADVVEVLGELRRAPPSPTQLGL